MHVAIPRLLHLCLGQILFLACQLLLEVHGLRRKRPWIDAQRADTQQHMQVSLGCFKPSQSFRTFLTFVSFTSLLDCEL